MSNRNLGNFGEAWAVAYLTRNGYEIVARNVRIGRDEIDIIAREGDELVFVEVKCRRGERFGMPEESITPARFTRLARAVEQYVTSSSDEILAYRIDVLALSVDGAGRVCRHHLLRAVAPPG